MERTGVAACFRGAVCRSMGRAALRDSGAGGRHPGEMCGSAVRGLRQKANGSKQGVPAGHCAAAWVVQGPCRSLGADFLPMPS